MPMLSENDGVIATRAYLFGIEAGDTATIISIDGLVLNPLLSTPENPVSEERVTVHLDKSDTNVSTPADLWDLAE